MGDKAISLGGDKIKSLIYEIRGKQVMFDFDLARLYGCKNGTKEINQAVKNNPRKFPERYSFVLTEDEFLHLRSKNLTAKDRRMSRFNPRVFTEQGVAMLATVLHSEIATEVSIRIMDAFVAMRHFISDGLIEQKYINELVIKHDKRLGAIEETLSGFKEKNTHLFFEGQIYDAYSLLKDILKKSEREIVIIDNYVDKNLLDMLAKIERIIVLVTNKYNNSDYEKYRKQYDNIKLVVKKGIHDRFIIIDRKILYHCGASFKDLGNKCFAINKIEDGDYLEKLVDLAGLT